MAQGLFDNINQYVYYTALMKYKINILIKSLEYFLIIFCFHDKKFYIIIIKVINQSKVMTI